ncbi:MAG: TerB family tellurite resistance protein [Candidatus Krumholzibacteriota bacterium]|nr:TerB family tellurite resistance protein [Candidatus Krumholzibacteriota bacterium]
MTWYGKLTFGSLGLFIGGPLGAIAGAALGHHFVDKKMTAGRSPAYRQSEQAKAAFFVSVFSILGKLAKTDGIVTRDELGVVDNFISSMNISAREENFARKVFNEAKNSRYSIDDFANQLYRINRRNPAVLLSFMDVLFQVAAADGKLHPAEENALGRIRKIFNISNEEYKNLKARYFEDVDKYYKILGCNRSSSDKEIKTSYRKLVKDFHPDTIVSKGLPEEFIDFATRRFEEIQTAYEKIKKERGF